MYNFGVIFKNKDNNFIKDKVLKEVIPYIGKRNIIIGIYNEDIVKAKEQEDLVDILIVDYVTSNNLEDYKVLTISNGVGESYGDIYRIVKDYVNGGMIKKF